ncbi:MAG: hypothetical protein H6672_09700 [Anaerolineaceae bacterium]|nr:hypothetical protein [Anaerolineaceae bacterium]
MPNQRTDAPPPDLRIVPTNHIFPHEDHDSQRAMPLIKRLKHEKFVINPPLVAPMDANQYVVLDGANRYYAFAHLEYPHMLVQVAPYESNYVELLTWRHIVSEWDADAFIHHLEALHRIQLVEGQDSRAIAHILFHNGRVLALRAPVQDTHERNAALREVVSIYQRNATLYRTALSEMADIWPLYPDALAVVVFPEYQPADIIAAARYQAFLPPGISRHIVHGRALRVNYPLDWLRDTTATLEAKSQQLKTWMQQKLAARQVRYYAEATYQFDE